MDNGGSPMFTQISPRSMRNWLGNLLLWAVFLSLIIFKKAAVDGRKVGILNEFPSPNLNSSMNVIRMGQNVSLSCSSRNISLEITYSLFLGTSHLETKIRKDEPVIFHRKISKDNDLGPYKCKAQVLNRTKYSKEFNFTIAKEDSCPSCLLPLLLLGVLLGLLVIILILVFWIRPKYKARKAQRENWSKDSGDIPMQDELYANMCKTQAGAGQPQELHYGTLAFEKMAPREEESCPSYSKPECLYSELSY